MKLASDSTLGRCGLQVPRLGLGGHTFLPRFGGRDRPADAALQRIIGTAFDCGVVLFDVTFDPERELLGKLLRTSGRRGEAFVSCWAHRKTVPDGPATLRECERALGQLDVERLDHFYLDVDITESHADAFSQLKHEGKIRSAGVLTAERAASAPPGALDVVGGVFNYYRRHEEPHLAAAHAAGLGCIGVEPFGRGSLLQEFPNDAPRTASALLRFARHQPFLDAVFVTMTSEAEVRANAAAAAGGPITAEDQAWLKRGTGYDAGFDPWK